MIQWYICRICGTTVPECDLREHLEQHAPGAHAFEWEEVRDQYESTCAYTDCGEDPEGED